MQRNTGLASCTSHFPTGAAIDLMVKKLLSVIVQILTLNIIPVRSLNYIIQPLKHSIQKDSEILHQAYNG